MNILNNPQILNDSGVEPDSPKVTDGSHVESAASSILPDGFLDAIVREAGAGAGVVRIFSSDSQGLQMVSATGLPAAVCERERLVESNCGVCGEAIRGQGIRAADAAFCAHQSGQPFFGTACGQVIAAPLEYRSNRIGVLTLFYPDAQAVPSDLARILRSCAELVGIALENGRRQETDLRGSLMAERHALANEIHDTLAHTLYYARMRMNLLFEAIRTHNDELVFKCAQDVDEALGSGQKAAREIITHFRCQMDHRGLQYALQALVDEFCGRTGIALTYTNKANFRLPIEHELQVFRIVREALANVAAHSRASQAALTVDSMAGRCVFAVEDNGCGCGTTSSEGHYGLMIMRERALRIGGEISVESAKGRGTQVKLSFPEP